MSASSDLGARLASIIRQRATNAEMPALGLSVGLEIPPYGEGVSKRHRAGQALASTNLTELGEIARRLGTQLFFATFAKSHHRPP